MNRLWLAMMIGSMLLFVPCSSVKEPDVQVLNPDNSLTQTVPLEQSRAKSGESARVHSVLRINPDEDVEEREHLEKIIASALKEGKVVATADIDEASINEYRKQHPEAFKDW